MKKLIIVAVLVFAFAITMNVAFAFGRPNDNNCGCNNRRDKSCCPSVEVDSDNDINVTNRVSADSNTGGNITKGIMQKSRCSRMPMTSGSITTGDAYADALADTTAGLNDIMVTAPRRGSVEVDADNDIRVMNAVSANANTGRNISGRITTGDADALSTAMNMLGSNVITID